MSTWTNFDGLEIDFGVTQGKVNITGSTAESTVRTLVVDVDYESILEKDALAEISIKDAFIPAGSYIRSAVFNPTTSWAAAGAATLTIGLGTRAGVVIDADGIDATIAKTALASTAVVDCDGALVGGTLPVGTSDACVYFTTATGPWTAGAGRLTIEYITDAT